jgi:hypothetical protein
MFLGYFSIKISFDILGMLSHHESEEIDLIGFSVKKTLEKPDYNTQASMFGLGTRLSRTFCGRRRG